MRKSYRIRQIEPGMILNKKKILEWHISDTTATIVNGKRLSKIIIRFEDDSTEFAYLEETFD